MSSNASPFRPVPTLGAFNLAAVFDTNDCWNNLNIAAPGFFETAIVSGAVRLFRETGIVLAIDRYRLGSFQIGQYRAYHLAGFAIAFDDNQKFHAGSAFLLVAVPIE